MGWLVCFILALCFLAAAAAYAVVLAAGKYRRGRILTPLNLLFAGVFLSTFICLLPIYASVLAVVPHTPLETAAFALHHTFQVFTIDADREVILESVNCAENWLYNAYSVYLSLVFIAAPILTFSFLVSLLKNASANLRYLLGFFRPVYVFSGLNEQSLALGSDLRQNHPKAMLVYTDVREKKVEEDGGDEFTERARELRSICFRKDIQSVDFGRHRKKSPITFFAIGEKEEENVDQALKLIEQYHARENTGLYIFSSGIEGELLLNRAEKGKMKVRRVNEERSLINRLLYEEGTELFNTAKTLEDGDKLISAVIVGLGGHGREMLKALSWYCQMDGYHLRIDAFDREEKAEDRFAALAPELMSEKYNGVTLPEEAEYTICIHSGCDVSTKTFADEIGKLKDTTYAFVSLGSDEANIRTAAELRMLFERMGIKPVIRSVIRRTASKKALSGITNYRGQAYDIQFFGDLESSFSEAVIVNSELEADALQRHLKWGKEEEFWQYEYNYQSSVATAIHRLARIACGIPGAEKREEDLTQEEKKGIEKLEHRRWNAYMRSEGYIYSGSPNKASRNDLAKMHHDLVDYSTLDPEERRKDSRVGTL